MDERDDIVRVLVVDDAEDARAMLVAHLRLDGYAADSAAGADEALRMIDSAVPHCVLLDIQMPGTDGLELARRLRQRYRDDIVLIAITGQSPSDARVADTFRLVDHYLSKPLDLDALHKVLPRAGG